jgi:uncharacterized membrane protein YeiB
MIWIFGALLVLVAGIVVASFLLIKFVFFAILAMYGLVGIILFLVFGPEHLAAVIVGTLFWGTIILFALKSTFLGASETIIPQKDGSNETAASFKPDVDLLVSEDNSNKVSKNLLMDIAVNLVRLLMMK